MMMCPDNTHSTTVDYSYDNANRMTAAGGYTYGYDADGNRTSVTNGTTTNYTFDLEDRLTGIGTGVSYDYSGASTDRYSKTVSGTTTQFLYDNGSVDEEMLGTTYTAVYGAAAEKLGANNYWMLQDGQGSSRQLLDNTQATVAAYITDSYGNSVSSTGSAVNPFKWNGGSGYYSDAESGLQKVGARYYEPATGRWISQDSLLIAGSPVDGQALNRYAYCEGNPAGRADPSGRQDFAHTADDFSGLGWDKIAHGAGIAMATAALIATFLPDASVLLIVGLVGGSFIAGFILADATIDVEHDIAHMDDHPKVGDPDFSGASTVGQNGYSQNAMPWPGCSH